MKFPSLREMGVAATDAIKRFPLVMISALYVAVTTWTVIDEADIVDPGHVMAGVLGIGTFLAIALFAERRSSRSLRWILATIAAVLLVIYGVWLGDKPEHNLTEVYRFALLFLAVHLFVSFAGFIRSGGIFRFWEFNKTLFLRLLLSALFSGVLFGGLAVAMVAVDQLLLDGIIDVKAYPKLFVLVGTIFNTLFFLAGIPRLDSETVERDEESIVEREEETVP